MRTRAAYTNGLSLLRQNAAAQVYGAPTVTPGEPILAVGFSGQRRNPDFFHKFKTQAELETYVETYLSDKLASYTADQDRRAARRASQAAEADALAEKLNPGTLLATNWGYDQTNVEFYQVIARKGRRVTIRRICGDLKETGMMSGHTTPCPNVFSDRYPDPIVLTIRSGRLTVDGHYASITEPGESHSCSWYA